MSHSTPPPQGDIGQLEAFLSSLAHMQLDATRSGPSSSSSPQASLCKMNGDQSGIAAAILYWFHHSTSCIANYNYPKRLQNGVKLPPLRCTTQGLPVLACADRFFGGPNFNAWQSRGPRSIRTELRGLIGLLSGKDSKRVVVLEGGEEYKSTSTKAAVCQAVQLFRALLPM